MIPAAKMNRDKQSPRLNKPSSQQSTLAPRVSTIFFSQFRIFVANLKGFSNGRPGNHVVRFPLKPVHRIVHLGCFHGTTKLVERR